MPQDRLVEGTDIHIPSLSTMWNKDCPLCAASVETFAAKIAEMKREYYLLRAAIHEAHPKCSTCGIFLGEGHIYEDLGWERCGDCEIRFRKGRE